MPDFTTIQRERLANRNQAMPDGGFPIRNVSDLKNAIQAYGRAKNKPAVKAWIKKRARELNAVELLPEKWRNDSLVHHGIKGQKWGVRRYQNKNGTYTSAGLMRLRKDVKRAQRAAKKEKDPNRTKGSTGKNYDEAARDISQKQQKFSKKWDDRVTRELFRSDVYDSDYGPYNYGLLDMRLSKLAKENIRESQALDKWISYRTNTAKLKDVGLNDSEARSVANWLKQKGYRI